MRNIVSISLPKQLDEQIEKEVKTGNFASKSEFIRSHPPLAGRKIISRIGTGQKRNRSRIGQRIKIP